MKKTFYQTLVVGAIAATLSGGAYAVHAKRTSGEASFNADVEIPKVPVRVLRPNAVEPSQPIDAFSTSTPVTVDTDTTGLPAAYQLNAANLIAMQPGQNVFVPIAVNHPNRFLTPFKNPQVVSTTLSGGSKKGDCGEICIRGNVVYISTDKTFPVTAFITEKGREDIALSITMLPKQIPPREVKLTLPESVMSELRFGLGSGSAKEAQVWETSQPYVDTLRTAFRDIAKGTVPQGYVLRKVKGSDPVPTCSHPGLAFDFVKGQILEGYNLNFYVGVVTNVADSPVEFREQRCGGWKVAAVTSWPLKVLKPGQKTEVYVAVKRDDEVPAESVRKPLIEREYN